MQIFLKRKFIAIIVLSVFSPLTAGEIHAQKGSREKSSAAKKAQKAKRAANQNRHFFPPMNLYNIASREHLLLQLYDSRGRIRTEAVREFSRFMRSHRTGEKILIHWRVAVILYEVWLRFGQPQVTIYSGYRPPSICSLKTSKHTVGEAVDFSLDGIDNAEIRDYLLKHWFMVGVGYYPNSYHVHLDVRSRKTFWIDYGGPGEGAMYAQNPYEDLRRGIAKRGHVPERFRRRREAEQAKAVEKALANVKQSRSEGSGGKEVAENSARKAKNVSTSENDRTSRKDGRTARTESRRRTEKREPDQVHLADSSDE